MFLRRATLYALAVGSLAAGGVARAQPVTGTYVSLGAGGNYLQDESLRQNNLFPGNKLRFDIGETGVGAVGYGFGNGFRVELEGNYRTNDLQHLLGTTFPTEAGGRQQNYGAMANLVFDLDVGQSWIYPYFGAGVGYSLTQWDDLRAGGTSTAYEFDGSGTKGRFAYQGLFGVSLPISYVPGLSFTAEYRFFSVLSPEGFSGRSSGTEAVAGPKPDSVVRGNSDITTDYNHSVLIGLRYALFQPPPPTPAPPAAAPAPAPAPEASRTYLVFFDWDRADLTARARQIVAEAAAASTHVQTTRIEVNGYTDLSGTPAYNQRLSVRRADAVEAELVRDGVAKGEIDVHGLGESNPLVPTANGVREPQNRRVEIIIH